MPRRPAPSPARGLAHLSDEAVVALVARAEEPALAELYDRYGAAAYSLARRILRDASLAEDAVQEAYLAIWRGAGRFVPERARAASWIMTLVHRRAVDLVRREQRRRAEPLPREAFDEGGEPVVRGGGVVASRAGTAPAALLELPDQQREVIELAYYGGFTQSEVAERLGRPLGTIKSQMYHGLARLRDLLAGPVGGDVSWTKA